jgi:hypothetical protein
MSFKAVAIVERYSRHRLFARKLLLGRVFAVTQIPMGEYNEILVGAFFESLGLQRTVCDLPPPRVVYYLTSPSFAEFM